MFFNIALGTSNPGIEYVVELMLQKGVQAVSELGRTNLVNEILGQISGVTRGGPAVGASPTKEPSRGEILAK